MSLPSVGAILVAAGSSIRMGGIDKLWADLGGRPLLARTLEAVSLTPGLSHLVVVTGAHTLKRIETLRSMAPWSRVDSWVLGGNTRQDSVLCGLLALPRSELVLIHDGARPLVSATVLERAVAAVRDLGAVIAAAPVSDTIKVVDDQGRIVSTPARVTLRAAQTPQVFSYQLLQDAYAAVSERRKECTDDAAIAELAGYSVYVVEGDSENIKVSTPSDLALVRALWSKLHPEQPQ
jgi:2-C-methyl-D-erythritol 4-phosphate cytidylyltransferase